MPIKQPSDYRGKQPKQVRDIFEFFSKDGNGIVWEIDETMFYRTWGNNLNEYEQALVNLLCTTVRHHGRIFDNIDDITLLTATIWDNFGLRKLFKNYYENYTYWEGVISDFSYLQSLVECNIVECIHANRYKWGNLMKSMLLEFNPLWNVDGVEETTRTLEQDGTITNRKRGSDSEDEDITTTLTSSENDTTHKTGNDRTLTDESTSESHTGTVNRENDGDNLTTNNLSDTTTYAGSEINSHQIHTTAVESKTTTESETLYTASKVENTGAGNDNVDTKEFNNRTDTLAKGGTVREQISSADEETRNLADTIEHDNDVTTTYNTTDTTTRGASSSNVVDRSNVLTHNTDDTETRDLLDTERITHKRTGNIGVTTTTKLLTEFREYSKFDIVEIVAHDIVNSIAESVY